MNHLEDAKRFLTTEYGSTKNDMFYNQVSIAHALIAIAEELKTANKLKRLELKGTPGFKIKPDDIDILFQED